MGMGGVKQQRGAHGERWAEEVLSEAGMVVLDRNWRCGDGEIDLVAIDDEEGTSTVVFCEVKYRTGTGYGQPLEAVTREKVRRLRLLALRWLAEHQVRADRVRLDAVGVLDRPGRPVEVAHVRGIGG